MNLVWMEDFGNMIRFGGKKLVFFLVERILVKTKAELHLSGIYLFSGAGKNSI